MYNLCERTNWLWSWSEGVNNVICLCILFAIEAAGEIIGRHWGYNDVIYLCILFAIEAAGEIIGCYGGYNNVIYLCILFDIEAAGEIIGRYGGVQDLLSALRAFPDNKDIASNCCGALWSLAVNGIFISHLTLSRVGQK